MKKELKALLFTFIILIGVNTFVNSQTYTPPLIVPIPKVIDEVENPVELLNGVWKFSLNPEGEFWRNDVDFSAWNDIHVPGEPWMQGFEIKRDVEYPYKKIIHIPENFTGKRIILQFDGVYSKGRVWVNGQFVGEHYGGFTRWNVDITSKVTVGKNAVLTVGIIDITKDPSFASGYASRYFTKNFDHFIGGILRNVRLIALPQNYISTLHYQTDFDADYQNANLIISSGVKFHTSASNSIKFSLFDPNGKKVKIVPDKMELNDLKSNSSITIPVRRPLKWDSEHPYLYRLKAELVEDGKVTEQIEKNVGFKDQKVVGNRFLVNGQEVKLRGGCRHSIHPLAGRAYVEGIDEKDVLMYKRANINYIRTSHYPTTEEFLDLCDHYGIYVEEEMAICWTNHFAADGKLNNMESDPAVLPYFMTQISGVLERDKSHPSIVMWSLGNENVKWGKNFEIERDYARKEDPTRPLKTGHNAYKGGWDTDQYLDFDSYHYPDWNSNFNKSGKPYLFDEYAHVLCYYENGSAGERDPGTRNFWGESLKRFWDKIEVSSGTAGGAIWGTIDDVFLGPNDVNGYGEWGIMDGWRRPKPEYYLTKKAYSPIYLEDKPLNCSGTNQPLNIPVRNRFNHTNFNELSILWSVGNVSGRVKMNLAPHQNGLLTIPARKWNPKDTLHLIFKSKFRDFEMTVDEFRLPLSPIHIQAPVMAGTPEDIEETDKMLKVKGKDFEIVFDKTKGFITSGRINDEEIITSGPHLNLTPYFTGEYKIASTTTEKTEKSYDISVKGKYDNNLGFDYVLSIDKNGQMSVDYTVSNPPASKEYDEVGLYFVLNKNIDRLDWNRKGLWSVYPQDHIGRNKGTAYNISVAEHQAYRQEPSWSWSLDMKDFHQRSKNHEGYGMTNDFRSSKQAVYVADAVNSKTLNTFHIASDGNSQSVRMDFDKTQPMNMKICINRQQTYLLDWGNYEEKASIVSGFNDKVWVKLQTSY